MANFPVPAGFGLWDGEEQRATGEREGGCGFDGISVSGGTGGDDGAGGTVGLPRGAFLGAV